jgi:hypothetical protein
LTLTFFLLQFRSDLVCQGRKGGRHAATVLRDAVQEDVKNKISASIKQISLLVRIFGSVTSRVVGRTYPDAGSFYEFVRGFNTSIEECYYVDTGGEMTEIVQGIYSMLEFNLLR